jgi:hypothetical protein
MRLAVAVGRPQTVEAGSDTFDRNGAIEISREAAA